MTNETQVAARGSKAAALLESMRAVQQALARPSGLSTEQLKARLQEWQQWVAEMANGLARGPMLGAELATLYEIVRVMNSSLDLTETLGLVMDSLIHLTGAERGCLMLLDEGGNLEIRAAQNFDQEYIDAFELNLSHTVVQEVVDSRRPVLTTNAQRDPRFAAQDSVIGYQLRSIVCVPLCVQQRVIGALYLDNRMRDGVFSQTDLPILAGFARQAAVAIKNARLYTTTERALAARMEELKSLREKLDVANRAQSDFISFVAHELRAPMTSIRGYADMLGQGVLGPLTPQQEQFVETIRRNAKRMQAMVSDLQDVSRIEAGRLRLEAQPMALVDAVESGLQEAREQVEGQSHQLTLEVPEDLPLVQADPERLVQVLAYLLRNACQYTPDGGQVHVRAWLDGGRVRCAVSDTGIGISPEDQAQLFTKFFRSEDPVVREVPGTGLGLCIAKGLVELQGGELEVESQPGEGTTVTFTVPVASG